MDVEKSSRMSRVFRETCRAAIYTLSPFVMVAILSVISKNEIVFVLGMLAAAFAVWLAVRTINRRPGWTKRMVVSATTVALIYVLSFGPACWMTRSEYTRFAPQVYFPMGWACANLPSPIPEIIVWYATVGNDADIVLPTSPIDGGGVSILN
jgi:hypothetical protein